MSAWWNSPRFCAALLAPFFLAHPGFDNCSRPAGGGYQLSLSALLARQELQPGQIFVGAADFDGDGRKSVVAVTTEGWVQIWSWRGGQSVNVYGPATLPQWTETAAEEAVSVADIDGDGRDEILRASDGGFEHQRLLTYEWKKGRFRLKHACQLVITAGGLDDLNGIAAVVRGPKTDPGSVVLLTHNREDAATSLLFYRLDRALKEKGPLEGDAIFTGLFSLEYIGSAPVDLDGDGTDEWLVSLEGQRDDFSRQPAPKASRLQAYRYSPTTKTFALQREWRDPPAALKGLFGSVRRGHEALLAGMDAGRLVFCHWDGKGFTTQDSGEPIRGEPRAFTDLGGQGGYCVIALEGTRTVWVSDPIQW